MIKPAFHIQSSYDQEDSAATFRLLIILHPGSLSYVLMRRITPVVIKHFDLHRLKDQPMQETLKEIFLDDEVLSKVPEDTYLIYNFPECSLVPEKYFEPSFGRRLPELIYGKVGRAFIMDEKIPWWELHNVYRIPEEVHSLMVQKCGNGKYWHYYSMHLKSHKMFLAKEEEEYVSTVFHGDSVVVMLLRQGKLLLLQSFTYSDPKDALYHILNCCRQFNFQPDTLTLSVGGLVERDSALYRELEKYFMNVVPDVIGDNVQMTDELREYPMHYFSPLLKMAVCV